MKKIVGFAFALAAISILHGCLGRTLTPIDLAGSKADGTVVMGVVVGEFDEVNWAGAQGTALSRCRAWGYSNVSAFSGVAAAMRPGWRLWNLCAKGIVADLTSALIRT